MHPPLHLLGVGRDKSLEENLLEKVRNVFVLEGGFVMGGSIFSVGLSEFLGKMKNCIITV